MGREKVGRGWGGGSVRRSILNVLALQICRLSDWYASKLPDWDITRLQDYDATKLPHCHNGVQGTIFNHQTLP